MLLALIGFQAFVPGGIIPRDKSARVIHRIHNFLKKLLDVIWMLFEFEHFDDFRCHWEKEFKSPSLNGVRSSSRSEAFEGFSLSGSLSGETQCKPCETAR